MSSSVVLTQPIQNKLITSLILTFATAVIAVVTYIYLTNDKVIEAPILTFDVNTPLK